MTRLAELRSGSFFKVVGLPGLFEVRHQGACSTAVRRVGGVAAKEVSFTRADGREVSFLASSDKKIEPQMAHSTVVQIVEPQRLAKEESC